MGRIFYLFSTNLTVVNLLNKYSAHYVTQCPSHSGNPPISATVRMGRKLIQAIPIKLAQNPKFYGDAVAGIEEKLFIAVSSVRLQTSKS